LWRLRPVVALVAALLVPASAHAQNSGTEWWESIQGFGSPSYSDNSSPRQVRAEVPPENLNDLRPDSTPWRSDVTLQAIDEAIGVYQQIAAAGGWPQIPGNRMIRPGDDDERVPLVRKRLRITGDMRRSGYESLTYDEVLEAGVKRFQERHGIRPSGRVDRPTLAALNVSAEQRLAQLRLNYERIRELLHTPVEERYVLVNAPAFQLEAVDRFEVQRRHRVIVGRAERQTPTIKATIRALNFFPFWRVPDSVAQLDLIPKLQKEPEYLTNEGIRVFDASGAREIDSSSIDWRQVDASKIKFKQDPGPRNALGLVRIDMPNSETVYMHDTPLKKLFEQRSRPFSAGCVRVQDVFKLVEWIARFEPGFDQPGRVEDVVAAGEAADVTLTRPIPVYFTYITAWAEADGRVEFRSDIYNRDGSTALAGESDPDAPPPPPQGLAP